MPQVSDAPVYVLKNASAGPATADADARDVLDRLFGDKLVIVETNDPEEGEWAVRRAAGEASLIVAAGGDGTINAVINILMERPTRPPLGLIPLGTGNSLCRTLGIPLDPLQAYATLGSARRSTIDLARVTWGGGSQHFACVASGGNSDRVLDCLQREDKLAWGPWCYLRSALPVVSDLRAYNTRIQHDGGTLTGRLWNVLVANGPIAAGGLQVAPRARMDDGLLDVVLIEDGTPLDLASLSAEFFLGDYLEDERVTHLRTRRLTIEADPEIRFLADGERFIGQPFEFESVPAALEIIVP